MSPYSRQLAEFTTSLRLGDVPPEVIARAKSVILDGIGCGLFGAALEWTHILAKVIGQMEPGGGKVSVWGRGETASAASAALLNGTMIQGFELDDANPASIHSCAAVLPAAIAAAEQVGPETISGEAMLTAIIAGFEVGPRVGLCMNGNRMLVKGWHTPGIFGPFPAAAAAGRVLGLDTVQLQHALGIAGPQAAGLMATQYGSMVKRMLSAKAAQSGLYAALLAKEGFTGVEEVFEQPYGGYCVTFGGGPDQFDMAALTDGLGTRWETMRISIKRHACVGTNLSALDAIEELMVEGLTAGQVEHVTVRMTEDAVRHSFWSPYEPSGLTAAQMHLGFCIATKLIDGEVFVDQMLNAESARPEVMELCHRVNVVRDEAREAKGRPFARGAKVEVLLKGGQTLDRTVDNFLGSYQRPMSDEQMAQKYRRLAGRVLTPAAVIELERIVHSLEDQPSVTGLTSLLARGN